MPIPLGVLAVAGAGGAVAGGTYDLIETTVLAGTAASVTFSNLGIYANTYQHLQVRVLGRTGEAANSFTGVYSRLNSDSGANYTAHYLLGNGSTVTSVRDTETTWALTGLTARNSMTADAFSATIIDLLDPFETTKNKTFRALTGTAASANRIALVSALWLSTASVTSWTILPAGNNYIAGSRFSLYGMRSS